MDLLLVIAFISKQYLHRQSVIKHIPSFIKHTLSNNSSNEKGWCFFRLALMAAFKIRENTDIMQTLLYQLSNEDENFQKSQNLIK